ncbi:MAG: hypothetical protein FD152_1931 [Xanthobacteraceae bacterium]|nr:MAG: hypothetical protein FD152_1931 [Xanthobacteraceae bacterium]
MFDQTMKTAETYFGQMTKAFEGLSVTPGKLEVAPAVREFATRQAETAKARLADAQKASLDATAGLENASVAAAGFGAGLVRSAVEGAVANTTLAIEAAKDIAATANPQDAFRRYGDFVKAFGEANLARASDSFAQLRDAATDGAKAVQAEAEKLVSRAAKAA